MLIRRDEKVGMNAMPSAILNDQRVAYQQIRRSSSQRNNNTERLCNMKQSQLSDNSMY